MFVQMDVGSSESVNKALSAAIDQFKRPPTVIVNSAGITRDGFLLKMSEEDFDSVINVNLKVNLQSILAPSGYTVTSPASCCLSSSGELVWTE